MNFSLHVARRYLFSKKSTNAINIISFISMVGMGIGAAVLILLLSVFNGFEDTILSLYNSFYTDLVVLPESGKTFTAEKDLLSKIQNTEGVESYSLSLSENVYLEYNDKDYIGTLKGVDENFASITNIDSFTIDGTYLLSDSGRNYAYIGSGIAIALSLSTERSLLPLKIHIPKRGKSISLLPQNAFKVGYLYASGVFNLQQEINNQYIITHIKFLQDLLDYKNEVGAVEIGISDGQKIKDVQSRLAKAIGDGFIVKNKFEQQASLYRVMRTEKWTVFALLSFILFVISFNILGALSMLIIEKKKDIAILKSMGARNTTIQGIFILQGLLMSVIGGLTGIFIGLLICLLQIKFGIIQIPGSDNFVIDAYPVKVLFSDIVLVIFAIILISALASYFPSRRATGIQSTFREA